MAAPRAESTAASHTPVPPRERILAVARELFYRRGIHAVGVDSIAEAAGTNKMTLYRHFASKDELVAACLRETRGRDRRGMGRNCRGASWRPEEGIDGVVATHWRMVHSRIRSGMCAC